MVPDGPAVATCHLTSQIHPLIWFTTLRGEKATLNKHVEHCRMGQEAQPVGPTRSSAPWAGALCAPTPIPSSF